MSETADAFARLSALADSASGDDLLEALAQDYIDQRRYHDLFDVRLMQSRLRLGQPLLASRTFDELPEDERDATESAYIDACREVGMLLLEAGKIHESWMYLRPLGERAEAAAVLRQLGVGDDNLQQLIDIALGEGVDPAYGFRLVLDHYGTCNAITMFEGHGGAMPAADRRRVVSVLVRHVHGELLTNVKSDIRRRDGCGDEVPIVAPHGDDERIAPLITARPELLEGGNYHIDASHLGAVVRFARSLEAGDADDERTLQLAIDLTEYGRRLDPQYQFPGEEPFAEVYPSHGHWFRAALGEEVDAALAFFRDAAESLDPAAHGSLPVEAYVVLLARCGRPAEAMRALATMLPPGTPTSGWAPSLLQLGAASGELTLLESLCRERGDLTGFAASLVEQRRG
ncbi:MAG: hypothetical protein KDA63_12650 [Planctomycetales bacterium]|nr:hypothetical protein [Planctomycetales bacterium]